MQTSKSQKSTFKKNLLKTRADVKDGLNKLKKVVKAMTKNKSKAASYSPSKLNKLMMSMHEACNLLSMHTKSDPNIAPATIHAYETMQNFLILAQRAAKQDPANHARYLAMCLNNISAFECDAVCTSAVNDKARNARAAENYTEACTLYEQIGDKKALAIQLGKLCDVYGKLPYLRLDYIKIWDKWYASLVDSGAKKDTLDDAKRRQCVVQVAMKSDQKRLKACGGDQQRYIKSCLESLVNMELNGEKSSVTVADTQYAKIKQEADRFSEFCSKWDVGCILIWNNSRSLSSSGNSRSFCKLIKVMSVSTFGNLLAGDRASMISEILMLQFAICGPLNVVKTDTLCAVVVLREKITPTANWRVLTDNQHTFNGDDFQAAMESKTVMAHISGKNGTNDKKNTSMLVCQQGTLVGLQLTLTDEKIRKVSRRVAFSENDNAVEVLTRILNKVTPPGSPLLLLSNTLNYDHCAFCNKEEDRTQRKWKQCSRCRKVKYCCPEHQRLHWKKIHKTKCSPVSSNVTVKNERDDEHDDEQLVLL